MPPPAGRLPRRVAGNVDRLAGELALTLKANGADARRIGLNRKRCAETGQHFSVWSRVMTGSMTVVMPGALRPASSTADLTCAEAIGTR